MKNECSAFERDCRMNIIFFINLILITINIFIKVEILYFKCPYRDRILLGSIHQYQASFRYLLDK